MEKYEKMMLQLAGMSRFQPSHSRAKQLYRYTFQKFVGIFCEERANILPGDSCFNG